MAIAGIFKRTTDWPILLEDSGGHKNILIQLIPLDGLGN